MPFPMTLKNKQHVSAEFKECCRSDAGYDLDQKVQTT